MRGKDVAPRGSVNFKKYPAKNARCLRRRAGRCLGQQLRSISSCSLLEYSLVDFKVRYVIGIRRLCNLCINGSHRSGSQLCNQRPAAQAHV
jgi:hypothetical protein